MILTEAPRMGRKIRSPQHTWNLSTVPFAVTPFLAAPVLPGETLKNAVFQARSVTVPIKNSLIGWWKEYYFFYVKLSDLESWSVYERMLIDQTEGPVGVGSGKPLMYQVDGVVNPYVEEAYAKVIEWYFTDPLATASHPSVTVGSGTLAVARTHGNSVFDSLHADSLHQSYDQELVVGGDDKFTASELEQLMLRYQLEKSGGLTELTYDDWLRKQGVGGTAEIDQGKPELIRFVREWTYPANTVNAADGKVNSVCSWAIAGRIDKDRFFKEPGLILGVTVARPKVYLSNQRGAAIQWMTNMRHWLGGIIGEVNDATMQKFTAAAGPLANQGGDYWLDFRDLFMHGDQWLGHGATGTVALPAAGYNFPNDAMIASLFPDGSTKLVSEDGVINLRIASRVRDPYPTRSS